MRTGMLNVTTAGTSVRMPNHKANEVTVIARYSNTGSIYLGEHNVSASSFGAELKAGDSITLKVNNLNEIFLDSSVNGEGVSYVTV